MEIKCLKNTTVIGINDKNMQKMKTFFENNILDDEEIIFFINGEAKNNSFLTKGIDTFIGGGDYLIITNDRVIIIKRGTSSLFSGSLGEQVKSFYYEDITSIDISGGLGIRNLEVITAGQSQGNIGFLSKIAAADNKFEFTKWLNDDMVKIVKYIQTQIRNRKRNKY